MKLLKTLLAWLDWSTYGRETYDFPKSLCAFFWRSLFAIIIAPFAWPCHIWNLFLTKDNFKNEYIPVGKMFGVVGVVIHFIWIAMGAGIGHSIIDGTDPNKLNLGYDFFIMADGFLINYGKVLLVGIGVAICAAICLGILALAGYGIWMIHRFVTKKRVLHKYTQLEHGFDDERYEYEPSGLVKTYDAIKNKYCPSIDWAYLRTKK